MSHPLTRLFLRATALALTLFSAALLRADQRPLRVATLNTVLTEIAREIGGERAEVHGLIRPGVDPHTFDPSAAELREIVQADVVFISGLNLENYINKLAENAVAPERLVRIGDQLPHILSLAPDASREGHDYARDALSAEGERDPHWWHSIDNVLFAADLVRAEYARLRPASAEIFARNAQAYQQRLFALKGWASRELARIPPAARNLVTSHDAFGYFARDYGFAIHPISGLSTSSEPNAKHFAELITLIRRKHVAAVFAESSANTRLLQTLARETGVRLGGTLYADGLGAADTDAATYEGMVRHNISTIVNALAAR